MTIQNRSEHFIVDSLSSDLLNIANGIYNSSFSQANIFKKHALKLSNVISIKSIRINELLNKNFVFKSDRERLNCAEDFYTGSLLLRIYRQ